MNKTLIVTMLVSAAVAGLATGHTGVDDSVNCSGWSNHSGPMTAVGPEAQPVLYVVLVPADATQPGKWTDTDKTRPLSIWLESNGYLGLQTTAYSCTYDDGHPYAGTNPNFVSRAADTPVVVQP